nr:phage holin family protein [Corynebacterium sp. LK29]
MSDVDSNASGDASIGQLVSNASTQISALVRSEIELAKAEIAGEAKKGAVGGGFFAVAGVVALYSSFFFFFFLGWLLDLWLPTWAAFLIVFVLMLVIAGVAALLGLKKVKSIRKPEKTIESMQELKGVVPSGSANKSSQSNGMYT